MSDLLGGGVSEFDQALPSADRLRALLFLVDKKLDQRKRLQFQILLILNGLMLISLVMLVWSLASLGGGWALFGRQASTDQADAAARGWAWALSLIFVLAPFAMALLHYLWITFAQIYFRSSNIVDELVDTGEYQDFQPLLHKELLEDDGSFLSQVRNLLTVDSGLTGTLFSVASMACGLLPVFVQALVSYTATVSFGRHNLFLAIGVAVFYVLFLILAALKSWSLYRLVRSMR